MLWCFRCVSCICFGLAKLSAVSDDDWLLGGTILGTNSFDVLDNIHSLGNLAKDDVSTIQPSGLDSTDEELTSVGVLSGVSHGESTWSIVSSLEVLVLELHAIDGLTSGTVSCGKVTSLAHELWDHSVESGSLVVQWLSALADSLLSGAQSTEVLGGLWNDIGVQLWRRKKKKEIKKVSNSLLI